VFEDIAAVSNLANFNLTGSGELSWRVAGTIVGTILKRQVRVTGYRESPAAVVVLRLRSVIWR
jgi:hypothetical protein